MRVPLSWLGELVPLELTPEQLAERLTLLGMEVSAIDDIGRDWDGVVVGELLEVSPHPRSPRLWLTRVRVAAELELVIVCGATNIEAGQRVPVALPGSALPGDRRIEVTTIAGAESQGMLCSGAELGLTGDADGILILPPSSRIGQPLRELAGDVVLDVDVKPNRGDALSIVGLAREVSAATGEPLRWPDLTVGESGDATGDRLAVEVEDEHLCPRFVGRFIEGVRVGPSPWDVQRRLIAAGMRPVSNVVDASNYVMLELGKPVHTFDAGAIRDGRLVVRLARAGERLETLDHVQRELTPDTLLIADPGGPLALAGVMGGASSEVSAATRDVIVESAIFDPVSVRRTAFRYALRSEASLRFEKGQEPRLARLGADRAAALITRWAGGRAAVGVVDTQPQDPVPERITFRPQRIGRLLGEPIPVAEQRALLARVGVTTASASPDDAVLIIVDEAPLRLEPDEVADALVASIPAHRRDLHIEADLAEEIARIRGYETVAARLPDTRMPAYRGDLRRTLDQVRELLAGAGLAEVVTHGLVSPDDHARMGWGAHDSATIRVANPVTLDHSELRRSLLPGHLRVLGDNERQRRTDVRIFEAGALHAWREGGPLEWQVLGLLVSGEEQPITWDRPRGGVDTAQVKGILESLASRLSDARLAYRPGAVRDGVEHPGRCASVVALTSQGAEHEIGRIGELHPRLLGAFDVHSEHVAFAELDLLALGRLLPERLRIGHVEHLPDRERDIAVVVRAAEPAGNVAAVIREHGGPALREARLFDIYRGAPLEPSEKSLAYRLRFLAPADPPGDDTVEAAIASIVGGLAVRLGARLRA